MLCDEFLSRPNVVPGQGLCLILLITVSPEPNPPEKAANLRANVQPLFTWGSQTHGVSSQHRESTQDPRVTLGHPRQRAGVSLSMALPETLRTPCTSPFTVLTHISPIFSLFSAQPQGPGSLGDFHGPHPDSKCVTGTQPWSPHPLTPSASAPA